MVLALPTPHEHVRRTGAVKRRVRRLLAWLHLWVGLVIGSVFALNGVAGSILVFHTELLQWQHPQLAAHVEHVDPTVVEHLVAKWAPRGMRSMDLPKAELPVWQAYFENGERAYFSPDDGSLLLLRNPASDPLLWLHEWHTALLAHEAGNQILGIVGWVSLALLLTGLYLWWPQRGRLRAHLRVYAQPPARRWVTWHRSSGAILLPLLLLSTVTGLGMVYGKGFHAVLTATLGGEAPPVPAAMTDVRAVDWGAVLDRAHHALPGARVSRISVPKAGSGIVTFRARAAGEWHPNGRSEIHVDSAGRRVLGVFDASAQAAGARISSALYPLHIGIVGGTMMRWLTAATGLLPLFLLVTGLLFWWRRKIPGHRPD